VDNEWTDMAEPPDCSERMGNGSVACDRLQYIAFSLHFLDLASVRERWEAVPRSPKGIRM
jgi:hypothetical protein